MRNKINVAIIGIGNCASALVQGIELCKRNPDTRPFSVLGTLIKKYSLEDINFVCGFDVHRDKVGRDISEAIFQKPNCATQIIRPKNLKTPVFSGPVLDGLDSKIRDFVPKTSKKPVDIAYTLSKLGADIVINFLPSGSEDAARYYFKEAIKAGAGFINAIPVLIGNNRNHIKEAKKYRVPLIGDDIKSQLGATIMHRALVNLFVLRNTKLKETIQLDWGGDFDFLNLTTENRYQKGKKITKDFSITSLFNGKDKFDMHINAVDFIPFMKNIKEAYIRCEGEIFGNRPVSIHSFIRVEDAYNSAGIVSDAIRIMKIAKDQGKFGLLKEASAFFCKKSLFPLSDEVAFQKLIKSIRE